MAWTRILRGLGGALVLLALAMWAPLLAAADAAREAYLFASAITGFTGGAMWILARVGPRQASGFREAMAVILSWWFVAPIFGGLPFAFEGLSFVDAWFEAVSATTTTGGWLNGASARSSYAAMLWRAELEWFGGLASLAAASALFIRPQFIGVDTAPPPFAAGEHGSSLRALRAAIRAFAPVYAGVTLIGYLLIAASGASAREALILAMSAAASGGFVPAEGGIAVYSPAVSAAYCAMMVAGAANFIAIARAVRAAPKRSGADQETVALLALVLFVGLFFQITAGGGEGAVSGLGRAIYNAAAMATTNGAVVGEAPFVAALVTAVIGGSAVSTAGGLKLLRWLIIFRRGYGELVKLARPNAVTPHGGASDEFGVWIHFLAFALALGVLMLLVAAFGHGFEVAAAAAVACLANAGPALALADGAGSGDYAQFEPALRPLLAVAMILGRLEGVAALAVVNRSFWRS